MASPLHSLRSVRAKLVWIVAIISGIAVVAVTLASGVRGYTYLRQQKIEAVSAQALIVAMNSSAPLAFVDTEMAEEALAALRVVEGIEHAALVDADGQVFATFAPASSKRPMPPLRAVGQWREGTGFVLVVPVADRTGEHGRLQVNYSGVDLDRIAAAVALELGLLLLAALGLAWVLAHWLHPVLTAPIEALANATRQVRDSGDFGVRAEVRSQDELGGLAEGFNRMLERIADSQQALVEAQRRAEQASRLKDEFVATLSHELRTPLSPIVAWIHMLRLPHAAPQLQAGLDVMERNAKSLTLIIEDLLDMSRIVSGTLRLDVQWVDVDAIIRAAVETLEPAAQARQLDVTLDLATPAPVLRSDPARLQQIVWNLLSNAIKFSHPGGRVRVSTRIDGDDVHIQVSDDGTGIDPEFLPFVFDRFRQQDGSTTRTHGGLGLGLSIVRQLVELHGGSVTAHSPGRGGGATFRVSLPLARAPALAPPMAEDRGGSPPRLDGLVALVVEDQDDMREIIRSTLESAGARVHEASSAREAIEKFPACRPDVVVSDIGLPDIDGYELLGLLRSAGAEGLSNRVPAVALTAYARPDEQQRALDAGYQSHLSKPLNPAVLVAAVADAVGQDKKNHP